MKHLRPAIVLTAFFVVVTGIAFPVVVWGIGRAAFSSQAEGSLVRDARGNVIGSSLIGQTFTKPEYFHPRPSAAGSGYDAANSSGTNLGPTSDKLINGVESTPTCKWRASLRCAVSTRVACGRSSRKTPVDERSAFRVNRASTFC
jgi:K+-transporting ATPase KdpC subunit